MRIYEYETKNLLQAVGMPVPKRVLATTAEQAHQAAVEMKGPVVVKAQTLIKARGKAGLIVFADHPEQAAVAAADMFAREHHGEPIDKVLIEEKMAVDREMYLGLAVDYSAGRPTIIVSPQGGVDIEETSRIRPDQIRNIPILPLEGLTSGDRRDAAAFLTHGIPQAKDQAEQLIHLAYRLFVDRDMEMLEINPLVFRSGFGLTALDAAASVDEEALWRQPDLVNPRGMTPEAFERELDFRKRGWSYLKFDGDIGLLSSGAGVTMAILDLMRKSGGRPANFLDTAQMDRQGIYDAFHIFLGDPHIKTVVVNIFAGLNRCDDLAEGIRDFLVEHHPEFQVVIRMVGNREDDGRKILAEIGVTPLRSLEEMVDTAIRVTEEQT